MPNWWLSFNEYLIQNVAADNLGHFTKNIPSPMIVDSATWILGENK